MRINVNKEKNGGKWSMASIQHHQVWKEDYQAGRKGRNKITCRHNGWKLMKLWVIIFQSTVFSEKWNQTDPLRQISENCVEKIRKKVLKVTTRKAVLFTRGNTVRVFSWLYNNSREEDCEMPYSKSWKKNCVQGFHVYKICSPERGKIKIFPDKRRLKKFAVSSSTVNTEGKCFELRNKTKQKPLDLLDFETAGLICLRGWDRCSGLVHWDDLKG